VKEVWCQAKSTSNHGGKKWRDCRKCCHYCTKKDCELRSCVTKMTPKPFPLCCWKVSPIEWTMGRLDKKAGELAYRKRMFEDYIRRGVRPDNTWEGQRLTRFKKKFPKVYKEILKEFGYNG